MEEIILATRKGKLPLMVRRFAVCLLFAIMLAVFLGVSNYIISVIIGGKSTIDMTEYWRVTAGASIGGAGLALVAGAVCDILRSHPTALIVCGLFTLFGFMIRGSMVKPFDFLWFFDCGFFTPLLRGQASVTWGGWFFFWIIWHLSLITLFLVADIYKRKERKAL